MRVRWLSVIVSAEKYLSFREAHIFSAHCDDWWRETLFLFFLSITMKYSNSLFHGSYLCKFLADLSLKCYTDIVFCFVFFWARSQLLCRKSAKSRERLVQQFPARADKLSARWQIPSAGTPDTTQHASSRTHMQEAASPSVPRRWQKIKTPQRSPTLNSVISVCETTSQALSKPRQLHRDVWPHVESN